MPSKIQWTDETLNPVTGCTKVSAGCKNCYAERHANRFWGEREFSDIQCHPDRLEKPRRWKRPRMVFVNSMSDLFHEDVPFEFIFKTFQMMHQCPQHTFQVLTKRPHVMLTFFDGCRNSLPWPLPNVWLGVTAENQKAWDERVPLLCQTPAEKRFVSYEPALGPIDIDPKRWAKPSECFQAPPKLDWLICGGESGPHARPMHPDWARSVRDQCQAAGVPFFFKKWGQWQIASHENGHRGSMMPDSGERYTWVGSNGKTYNPSAPAGLDCWAMAKVGKKAAGRELDGRTWEEMPCQ